MTKSAPRKTASTHKRVERHIYLEHRTSDSVRYTVQVAGQPRSRRTFDLSDAKGEGLRWARMERMRLLGLSPRSQSASTGAEPLTVVPFAPAPVPPQAHSGQGPNDVSLEAVFAHYELTGICKLSPSSRPAVESRLKRLRVVFGDLKMSELTDKVLASWMMKRATGEMGGARSAWRGTCAEGEPVLTKDQRYRRRKRAGAQEKAEGGTDQKSDSGSITQVLTPPSSQTVRHELQLLRSACQLYYAQHLNWLASQPVMTCKRPASAKPRNQRINNGTANRIADHCHSNVARNAFLFACYQTLRRAEVVSLRWEHVDLQRRVVKLKAPSHECKTKTTERDVPLLPETIELLTAYGIKKQGQIFPITEYNFSQTIRRAADRAGLPNVRLHDARREAVSRLAEVNVNTNLIRVFTGHQTDEALSRFYCHPDASKVAHLVASLIQPGATTTGEGK